MSASDVRSGETSTGRPLAQLIAERDWAATPIGPAEQWPQSLRTALSICLESRFPILIWWGPEFVMLYNDAYAPLIGSKHPRALGQAGADCFPEIWDIIGPMLAGVRERGEATWSADQLLELERRGFPEECYFTFSYSPIRDETGGVGGIFTAVNETTEHVIGARRLRILREVSAAAGRARSPIEACRLAAGGLEGSVSVPFSLAYLFDDEASSVRLVATSGLDSAPAEGALARIHHAVEQLAPWRRADAEAPDGAQLLERLELRTGDATTAKALLVPLEHAGGDRRGAVVLGLNERRPADDDYLAFLDLVAGQIAAAIANAEAHEQERRRADALAELDRAKTRFFENVSHELRTPLTLILSPLEDLLAERGRPAREQREQLEVIRRNALRLLRLVNTLLDFSRAESGRIDALFQPTDLAAVTADLADAFRPAVERAGLELTVDCPPLDEPVWVDREAWEKIVLNLLSNALKFTFAGGIEVRLREAGDEVELRVRDTGVGIAAAELPHLFERFHRIRDVRARTHEGSGIGLALVRELAELHGASVSVESESGAGSAFTVRLRRGSAHLPADQVGGPEGTAARSLGAAPYVEEALRWLPGDEPAGAEEPEPVGLRDDLLRAAGVSRSGRATILIADDNADMRGYLARLLRRYWRVETAADGAEALAAVRRSPPDLVLSDVMMPGLDGFELLRALRGDPATRGVPVVLLSARAGPESAVEGLEAGADDYLVKPFSSRELIARVRANLELSELRVALAQLEGVAEERARAERLLETLPDGVLAVGPSGAVDLWNPAAERLTGLPRERVVGRQVTEVLAGWDDLARRLEARPSPSTTHPFELDGRELWLAVVSSPYGDGTLYAFRDATESTLLEQMRRDLVTTLSHELRTPVSSIYGATATLLRSDLPDDRRAELTEVLHGETERLVGILNDLLAASALDAGAAGLRRSDCDPRELVERAVERARPRCPATIELRATLPARCDPVRLDEQKLEQIVDTLVDNAIRYSPDGGEVEVVLEQEPARLLLSVRDTGIGIAERHHPHIGERFYRADPELHAGIGGLGLGLYVCRRLVALMDGRLWFDSADGEGSTFHVELPTQTF